MQYIRTKDGRIIDTEKEYVNHPANYPIQARDYALTIDEADTIEELCDAVVRIRQDKNPLAFNLIKRERCGAFEVLDWCKRYIERIVESVEGIGLYGAIWCDTGLKYVAKMNEKGMLELI